MAHAKHELCNIITNEQSIFSISQTIKLSMSFIGECMIRRNEWNFMMLPFNKNTE